MQTTGNESVGKKNMTVRTALTKKAVVPSTDFPLAKRKEPKNLPKKAALFMTYADTGAAEAAPIKSHYEVLLNYLGWEDAGQIIVPGVWPAGAVDRTDYPKQAYELGKTVK